MSTSYGGFVDALEALSVAGVTRVYTSGPPASLNTADMPAQWVQFPAGDSAAIARGTGTRKPTRRADLVVAVEKVGQGTQPDNFDAAVGLMDAVEAALAGFDYGLVAPSWAIRMDSVSVEVAGEALWAVVASVEVSG